jgi:hypothetical protein
MTEIINGPIYTGCFVRLRNGSVCGPVLRKTTGDDFPFFVQGLMAWTHTGMSEDVVETNISEILPNPFTASAPLDLPELKRLCDAATEGPWCYEPHGDTGQYGVGVILDDDENHVNGLNENTDLLVSESVAVEVNRQPDAAFIAAARTALPDLIAEVERLTANELDAAITIGQLNSAKPLQDLMALNNHLLTRANAAEAELDRLRAALKDIAAYKETDDGQAD